MRVIGITPINNDVKEEKSMKFLQKLGKALMLPGYRLYAVSRNYTGWRYSGRS